MLSKGYVSTRASTFSISLSLSNAVPLIVMSLYGIVDPSLGSVIVTWGTEFVCTLVGLWTQFGDDVLQSPLFPVISGTSPFVGGSVSGVLGWKSSVGRLNRVRVPSAVLGLLPDLASSSFLDSSLPSL